MAKTAVDFSRKATGTGDHTRPQGLFRLRKIFHIIFVSLFAIFLLHGGRRKNLSELRLDNL